jgi:hypothetical protein
VDDDDYHECAGDGRQHGVPSSVEIGGEQRGESIETDEEAMRSDQEVQNPGHREDG